MQVKPAALPGLALNVNVHCDRPSLASILHLYHATRPLAPLANSLLHTDSATECCPAAPLPPHGSVQAHGR